jgi:hypothetical protein
LYQFGVQSATTINTFIVMAKILTDIRSIFAKIATINLHLSGRRPRRVKLMVGVTRLAQCAERQAFCTMTMIITQTIVAVTKSAIILFLSGKTPVFTIHPCQHYSGKTTSSE